MLSVLAYAFPDDTEDSSTWPACESLIDHVTIAIKLADYQSWDEEFIEALYSNAGSYLHARGRDDQSARILDKALKQKISRYGEEHPHVALASNNLLNVLSEVGGSEEALELEVRATEILTRDQETREEYASSLGKVYSNVGRIFLHPKRDFKAARAYFRRALAIHLEVHGKDHYTTAIDINNLGTVEREEAVWVTACGYPRSARSNWKHAYGYFQQAISIHRSVLPPSDYRLSIALFNLGTAAYNLEGYAESEGYFREAVKINDILRNGAKGSDQIDALVGLGHAVRALGEPRESLRHFDRARNIAVQLYGPDAPIVKSITSDRGAAAFDLIRPFFCYYSLGSVVPTNLSGCSDRHLRRCTRGAIVSSS